MRGGSFTAMAAARAASPDRPADNIPSGIRAMIAATMFFVLTNAIAKSQVGAHPVGEVMCIRSAASMLVGLSFILPIAGLGVFKTRIPGAHIARGLSQAISQTFTVMALALMPLAGTMAINFSAPIWASAISVFALREKLGLARALVLGAGFAGVLIVARPGAEIIQMGALYALANAIMYGAVTVAVRGMAKTESAMSLLAWQLVAVFCFQSTLVVFGWDSPNLADISLIALSGVTNAGGQYYWTRALKLAPATAVSPFYYLTLVWALLLGFLVWGDVPTPHLLVGSLIVVASALMLLRRENKSQRLQSALASHASDQAHRPNATTFGEAPATAMKGKAWLAGIGLPR